MDQVSARNGGSHADSNVKTDFLRFFQTKHMQDCLLYLLKPTAEQLEDNQS